MPQIDVIDEYGDEKGTIQNAGHKQLRGEVSNGGKIKRLTNKGIG